MNIIQLQARCQEIHNSYRDVAAGQAADMQRSDKRDLGKSISDHGVDQRTLDLLARVDLEKIKDEALQTVVMAEELRYVSEIDTSTPGWDCDLSSWVFQTQAGKFLLTTSHGYPFIEDGQDVVNRLAQNVAEAKDSLHWAVTHLGKQPASSD